MHPTVVSADYHGELAIRSFAVSATESAKGFRQVEFLEPLCHCDAIGIDIKARQVVRVDNASDVASSQQAFSLEEGYEGEQTSTSGAVRTFIE